MKKIFSLFISLILISSTILTTFPSVAFAADEEIYLSKEKLDLRGDKLEWTNENSMELKGSAVKFFFDPRPDGVENNVSLNNTLFGQNVIFLTARADENTNTRLQVSTINASDIVSGKLKLSYSLYLAATSDGELYMQVRKRGMSTRLITTKSLWEVFNLSPYKWYDICMELNLDNNSYNIKATDEDGIEQSTGNLAYDFSSNPVGDLYLWGTPKYDEMPAGKPSELSYQKAFYAIKDIYISHDDGTKKAKILSIGSDGEVMHSQREISFKLSKKPEGLLANHIVVKNKINPSDTIAVSSAGFIQSDAEGDIMSATLSKELAPWTAYYLEISGKAYDGYKEVKSDGLYDVSSFSSEFHTPSAPFDIKEPDFTYDVDNSLFKASTTMINTTGAKDVCLVLASYSHNGKVKQISKKSYPSFEAVYPGSDADITIPAEDGDIIRFFVVDSIHSKKALFTKSWTINFDGTPSAVFVSSAGENTASGTIKLGDFDYDKKKIKVDVRHSLSNAANGVLAVYSDASEPVFADFITTQSDGSYMREISFLDNFEHGAYTVEFVPTDAPAFSDGFTYYTPEQLKENIRADILSLAKQAPNAGTLMQTILGIDENEEKINNHFDVFKEDAKDNYYDPDADTNSKFYELVKDKAEVFALMKKSVTHNITYPGLVALFNSSAKAQYGIENTTVINPSTNNNTTGLINTVVTENKRPSVSVGGGGGASGGGAMTATPAVPIVPDLAPGLFSDTNGHWAEKFMDNLSQRGIINGYEDGSFRPENMITRAEIAKLLTTAFGNGSDRQNDFTDVAPDSWYYKPISDALGLGIITGFEDGSFRPDSFVTRQDAILMMYRAMRLKKSLPEGYTVFKDDFSISAYALDATRCLGDLGIITGNENKEFMPQSNITRAELAAVVCRGLDYLQSH